MFTRNNLLLLRIPFSFFLLPVFCFALSQAQAVHWPTALLFFVLLHFLVYPASNAYNSYMDQDEGSIGGLRHPPKATRSLFRLTLLLDGLGLLLALLIHWQLLLQVALYIAGSKAYSYTGIRIKKYPVGSFLLVAVFQGGLTYLMALQSIQNQTLPQVLAQNPWLGMATATLLVGAVYPLTQVYQHHEDHARGDRTLSLLLGIRGTFIFSAGLFVLGGVCMALHFAGRQALSQFYILNLFMLPVVVYFLWWAFNTFREPAQANFDNTMRLNTIAAACLSAGFVTLFVLH